MIIGTVGFIGSGKGTAADILVEKHGFTKLSFADAVKDATAAIFGWPRYLLEGDTDESRAFRELKDAFWSERFGYDVTPRKMLQMMGTEAGRDVFHQDLWVYALERKMAMYENVVIADVRFPNEMEFLRSKGGFAVRVQRGPDPEWFNDAIIANAYANGNSIGETSHITGDQINECLYQMEKVHKVHISEWAWVGQSFDYVLHNESSISMLEADIKHMISVFTGPRKPATMAA